jgi:hypothetical protein
MAREVFNQVQAHLGVTRAHGLQKRQPQHGRRGRCQSHAHMPRQPRLLRGQHGIIGMPQGELRLAQKGQASVGGPHARSTALQQPRRQLAFEPTDLLAQGRHPHTQLNRRPAHAAGTHHVNEIAKLSKFHAVSMARPVEGSLRPFSIASRPTAPLAPWDRPAHPR